MNLVGLALTEPIREENNPKLITNKLFNSMGQYDPKVQKFEDLQGSSNNQVKILSLIDLTSIENEVDKSLVFNQTKKFVHFGFQVPYKSFSTFYLFEVNPNSAAVFFKNKSMLSKQEKHGYFYRIHVSFLDDTTKRETLKIRDREDY